MAAAVSEAGLMTDQDFTGSELVPVGASRRRWVIHFPVVVGAPDAGRTERLVSCSAPMTRCDPPQDGSGDLIDHHTG